MKGSYMPVENVLRYLQNIKMFNKKIMGLKQHTIEGETTQYFRCNDIAALIGLRLFRVMECEVSQLLLL